MGARTENEVIRSELRWAVVAVITVAVIFAAIIGFIALTVYNFLTLTKTKFCPPDLRAALMDHMVNCRVRSAIEVGRVVEGHSSSSL